MPFNTFNSVARLPKKTGGGISVTANWVAVGDGGLIVKSTDGNIWSQAGNVGGITTSGRGVAYGKDGAGQGLWVVVGGGGVIAKSSDGNLWSPAGNVGGLTNGGGVAYGKDGFGGNLWIAVGSGSIIAKSTDGNIWTPAGSFGGIGTTGYGVAFKEELFKP